MANPLQEKRGPKIGDAASLWNFTPSPGWTKDEVQILRLCLMKHGIGRWVQILEDGLLKGKLIQQLNGQTQRLLGQQSLAAYTGLQVDVDRIRVDNEAKTDVERKAGLIINTGPNLTKQMKQKLQEESRVKYGLTPEQIKEVEEKIDELKASLKEPDESTAAPGISLMGADPATLSKEQKVALLKRLRARLEAAYNQLQKASQAGTSQEAGAAAKPAEPRPTNSNAENEPAAANTDSMEVDPAAAATEPAAAAPLAAKPAKAGGAKRKASGGVAGGEGSGAAGGSSGATRKARTPKPKATSLDDDTDGDWKPKAGGARGGKGRSKRPGDDVEMQDSDVAGTEESAADVVQAANVQQLVEMGFSAKQAAQALEECSHDLDMALEWLAENCI